MEHQQVKKQPNQQLNNVAFVLGNGVTRLKINPANLMDRGTVIGCNALYREYEPHHLIAVDVKMINEIIASGYNKEHKVWTNPNKGVISKTDINFLHPHRGWSSGPTAVWFAAQQNHKHIFIFGFDYQGINGKFNNIYADTFNYKKSTDTATFHGNWLSQTEKVIKEYPQVRFYRVIEEGGFVPDKLGPHLVNLEHITFEQFEEMYENTVYPDQIAQKSTI